MLRAAEGDHGRPAVGPSHDAQQGADGQRRTKVQPRLDLLPAPAVHTDLAPLAALATADKHGAGDAVEIAFGQREGLADPQLGSPEHDDERSDAQALRRLAGGAHDGHELFDGRRVGRIAAALVARRAAAPMTGHGGRRTAAASRVEQQRSSHAAELRPTRPLGMEQQPDAHVAESWL